MTPAWAQRREEMLSDCLVSPDVFTQMVDRLGEFSMPYQQALETEADQHPMHLYLQGLLSYGQNIRTRLPTRGYASTIAGALICLPLHSHPYSASRGMAEVEGGGDGLETPAGVYHWDH